MIEGPPGATITTCPVDGCSWRLVHQVPTALFHSESRSVDLLDVMTAVAEAVRAHVATHSPIDYLRTIEALQQEIEAMKRKQAMPNGWTYSRRYAETDGYSWQQQPRRRSQLKKPPGES